MENAAICITAGEQSENHVGMQKNGNGLANVGFSFLELKQFDENLNKKGINCQFYNLKDYLKDDVEDLSIIEDAAVLIIKNGLNDLCNIDSKEMLKEQLSFEWDKHYWDVRRKKVLNKIARHNLCYGNEGGDPDYENKLGRIIALSSAPNLKKWKDSLETFFGPKANNLELEGNLYYDVKKCGIGFHGDGERKKVIACSLGKSRPIVWQYYYECKVVGKRIEVLLEDGDMYIMSEKASGFDWRKKTIYTLRHAAGEKYVNKK